MTVRNIYFDATKGFLIILVILGHVILGSLNENTLRYIIYFFHMPLFLAVTGYFISQKTISLSVKEILGKYKKRLIIPFIIAFVIYTNKGLIDIQSYLYPYYHLWYIPAIILFVLYTKFVLFLYKINKIISIILMALFVMCTIFFESYSQWNLSSDNLYSSLGDKRFFYFFSYFMFGYFLANIRQSLNINHYVCFFIIFISIVVHIISNSSIVEGVSKVVANIFIIYLLTQHNTTQHNTTQHNTTIIL
ncbi:acyltransferase family protein [Glaesserella parasuis]|nr:acyltransferase family protein [Glaesserella parasuis]